MLRPVRVSLSHLPMNPAGQLDVFGCDGDPLGVKGTEVSVLEQTHHVGLAGFQESHDGRALEAQVSLDVLILVSGLTAAVKIILPVDSW